MNENKAKAITGAIVKQSLLTILKNCQAEGKIVYCTQDFRAGYPNCSEKQFFAPFYIEFRNGTGWLFFSTNSIRSDRMCIQQWNAEHLKVLCPNITKAFVVVPSEVSSNQKEYHEVTKYNDKIQKGTIKSFIDMIIKQEELEGLIIENANN